MSEFPREARVPAAARRATPHMCNSTPCNTYRSFAICLIIAIIVTESPVSGFSIRRAKNNDEHEPDLSAEESSSLEVKYDLKRPNYISSDSQTKVDVTDKHSAPESTRNTSIPSKDELLNSSMISKERQDNITEFKNITMSNETTSAYKEDATVKTKISNIEVNNEENSNKTSNVSVELVPSNNSISLLSTSSSESVSELSTHKSADPTSTIQSLPTETQSTTTNVPKFIITGVLNFQSSSESKSDNSLKKVVQEPQKDFVKFITDIKTNLSKKDSSEVTTSKTLVSTFTAEDSMAKPSVTVDTTIEMNNDITPAKRIDRSFATRTPQKINTPLFQKTSGEIKTEETSQSVDNTGQYTETMTVEQTSSVAAEPLLKKYTEIDRKRIATTTDENTSPTIVNDNEMVTADNMRARVNLEKGISATPIISLEKLRLDLMSFPTQPSLVSQIDSEITQLTEDDSSSTLGSVSITRTPKREMVSSMRAGFLDLTAKTVEPVDALSTTAGDVNLTHEEAIRTVEEIETERIQNKTASGMESQSQLADDAIKEELLEEEMQHDKEENAKRYHDDLFNVAGIKLLDGNIKEPKISQENASDDSLSVKPISIDKSKLYAVSPNYKPMKKIDVQPSKQFVRDPDDNSWRNESISSLGIVFKPKNSSKSFTQVLRNKTEVEFTNLSDRNKNDQPELRERLEKIAEVRKSKKKRINKFGETIYTDYEENSASGEVHSTPKTEIDHELINFLTETALLSTSIRPTSPSSSSINPDITTTDTSSTTQEAGKSKQDGSDGHTTKKPNKFYNIAEYYDTTDEYDSDYLHLSKIDLKKFPAPFKQKEPAVTPPVEFPQTKSTYPPDRKATLQYFPPRITPKVKYNYYDDDVQKKVNAFPFKHNDESFGTLPTLPVQTNKIEQADKEYTVKPLHYTHVYKPIDITKNLYLTGPPRVTDPHNGYGNVNDGNYNRPAYVIKHFNQDFISDTKDDDEDKTPGFLFTEPPARGVTINDLEKPVDKIKLPPDVDYDYDSQFRKDIMNRFVDNFNQNSEKYRVDFPILYNNSVIHRKFDENGKSLASSSAFMKRLYNDVTAAKVNNYFAKDKSCDPNCDNITVELSPAYELHYYVPDQEEKEEVEQRPTLPNRYRL